MLREALFDARPQRSRTEKPVDRNWAVVSPIQQSHLENCQGRLNIENCQGRLNVAADDERLQGTWPLRQLQPCEFERQQQRNAYISKESRSGSPKRHIKPLDLGNLHRHQCDTASKKENVCENSYAFLQQSVSSKHNNLSRHQHDTASKKENVCENSYTFLQQSVSSKPVAPPPKSVSLVPHVGQAVPDRGPVVDIPRGTLVNVLRPCEGVPCERSSPAVLRPCEGVPCERSSPAFLFSLDNSQNSSTSFQYSEDGSEGAPDEESFVSKHWGALTAAGSDLKSSSLPRLPSSKRPCSDNESPSRMDPVKNPSVMAYQNEHESSTSKKVADNRKEWREGLVRNESKQSKQEEQSYTSWQVEGVSSPPLKRGHLPAAPKGTSPNGSTSPGSDPFPIQEVSSPVSEQSPPEVATSPDSHQLPSKVQWGGVVMRPQCKEGFAETSTLNLSFDEPVWESQPVPLVLKGCGGELVVQSETQLLLSDWAKSGLRVASVGLGGPQRAGKTTIARALMRKPHCIRRSRRSGIDGEKCGQGGFVVSSNSSSASTSTGIPATVSRSPSSMGFGSEGGSPSSIVDVMQEGLWMWHSHPRAGVVHVILDPTGLVLDGAERDASWCIQALAVLLSSVFLYNTRGVINRAETEAWLSLIYSSASPPRLVWLMHELDMALEDPENNMPVTAAGYCRRVLWAAHEMTDGLRGTSIPSVECVRLKPMQDGVHCEEETQLLRASVISDTHSEPGVVPALVWMELLKTGIQILKSQRGNRPLPIFDRWKLDESIAAKFRAKAAASAVEEYQHNVRSLSQERVCEGKECSAVSERCKARQQAMSTYVNSSISLNSLPPNRLSVSLCEQLAELDSQLAECERNANSSREIDMARRLEEAWDCNVRKSLRGQYTAQELLSGAAEFRRRCEGAPAAAVLGLLDARLFPVLEERLHVAHSREQSLCSELNEVQQQERRFKEHNKTLLDLEQQHRSRAGRLSSELDELGKRHAKVEHALASLRRDQAQEQTQEFVEALRRLREVEAEAARLRTGALNADLAEQRFEAEKARHAEARQEIMELRDAAERAREVSTPRSEDISEDPTPPRACRCSLM